MAKAKYLVEAWEVDALTDGDTGWYWNNKRQYAVRKEIELDVSYKSNERLVKIFAKLFDLKFDLRQYAVEEYFNGDKICLEVQRKKQDNRPVAAFFVYPAEWA